MTETNDKHSIMMNSITTESVSS